MPMRQIVILLLSFISVQSFSQTARIEGKVETDSSEALIGQFIVYSLPDSNLIKGGYLDSSAHFNGVFNANGNKDFYLQLRVFEYNDTIINFTLTDSVYQFPTIHLSNERKLDQVEVVYFKPEFVRTIDGIKVNVEGTNLQTLNTLFDVLVASPKISSPDNERIEIIGKGSPLILVDRQAIISNDELKAIPANMVESIEIITNPGSKYKAQGRSGGVIEVYTKNFHLEGYNMSIRGGAGINTQSKPAADLNIGVNVKKQKFSLNGYLGFHYQQQYSNFSSNGYSTDDSNRQLTSSSDHDYWWNWSYYSLKGAYQINDKQRLTVGFRGHGSFSGNEMYGVDYFLQNNDTLIGQAKTQEGGSTWFNNSAFVNYVVETDTFNSALEVNFNFTRKTNNSETFSYNSYRDYQSGQFTDFDIRRDEKDNPTIGELRIQYDHNFDTSGWNLQVGTIFSTLYNNKLYDQYAWMDNQWTLDSLFSNSYDYQEQIGGIYAELTKSWKKVSVRAGVRGEYTRLYGYSNSLDQKFIDSTYILPFPSASIMLSPTEKTAVTFSYSSGIYRPEFSNYDPFVRVEDSLSISYGNPFLRPEVTHTFGFDLDLFYAYNISLNYSLTDDPQSRLSFVDDSTFLVNSTPWNAELDQSFSVSINAPLQFKKFRGWNSIWWSRSKYQFTEEFGREDFVNTTYGINSYMTYNLPWNLDLMNALRIHKWGDAEVSSNGQVSWGMRLTKKMFDNNFQVYLDVWNIVPPRNRNELYAGNYYWREEGQNQFTTFKVGLFYKFGRLKRADQIKDSESGQSGRI